LAKLSRNYAEMSSRISSKEQECASRVVGDVCRILCSTINCSVCTLYWNKNIRTFWINGAFYWKIKSCGLVGTSYIFVFHAVTYLYQVVPRSVGTLRRWQKIQNLSWIICHNIAVLFPFISLAIMYSKLVSNPFSSPRKPYCNAILNPWCRQGKKLEINKKIILI
jgi:hypothetical protein